MPEGRPTPDAVDLPPIHPRTVAAILYALTAVVHANEKPVQERPLRELLFRRLDWALRLA